MYEIRRFICLHAAWRRPGCSRHHSFAAEYDSNQPITLKGTLTKTEWTNPHGWIYVDVKGDDGKVTNWAVEFGSPNALLRRGLRRSDFPAGIEVTVQGIPRQERFADSQCHQRNFARRAKSVHRIVGPECARERKNEGPHRSLSRSGACAYGERRRTAKRRWRRTFRAAPTASPTSPASGSRSAGLTTASSRILRPRTGLPAQAWWKGT